MLGELLGERVIGELLGVPSTAYTFSATWFTRSGRSSVSELLAPLRLRSGATVTMSSQILASAPRRALSPGA